MTQPMAVTLDGGLELELAKTVVPPGTLIDCLNYERNLRRGYTRIDGIDRFDGSDSVNSYKFWRLTSTAVTGTLTAGMAVYLNASHVGYVLTTEEDPDDDSITIIYTVFHDAAPNTTLPATLTGTGGASATIQTREVTSTTKGTVGTLNTALKALADTRRALIETVPGRTGTDIIHLFGLKNRLYAVRDLCRIYFTGGFYTDANEGHYVTVGGSQYLILAVTMTNTNTGYLTVLCTAGSGTEATPIGSPTPTLMTITGTLDDGYVGNAYSDSLSTTGSTGSVTWSIVGDAATPADPITPPDPGTTGGFVPGVQETNAALWRADSDGWTRVDLGREMAFRGGTTNIANFDRSIELDAATVKDTGFLFPSSSTFNGGATTNINSDNGANEALTGATGDYFIAKGFTFTSIPSTAIIKGIEVVIERQSNTANQAVDQIVDLVGVSGGTQNKAKTTTVWPNTIGTATYGGSSDNWGNSGITVGELDSDFGVRLLVSRASPATATIGGVDYIKIKVYYVERETPAYVWDGSTDVQISIRHIQLLGGDTSVNTGYGYITLTASTNAAKSRLISEGDAIRTAASGGGNLIGYVASRDVPIFLPGQEDIDGNAAQYKSLITNFYYQDNYDAAYTVQGVGPCWYFDGTRCIRIRVPLGDLQDAPRHVARHGTMLALGYQPGTLVTSSPSDVFEMRGARGANPFNSGDRMTVLAPVSGDALGIGGESTIQTLRGYTSDSFFRQTLTAVRGVIEYTDADMGEVICADALGLLSLVAPESLGAVQRKYLSSAVDSWLRERLQALSNGEQSRLRPIKALKVRNKNQYRLYFWDGYILTITMEDPRCITLQRYYEPSGNDSQPDTAWPVRSVASYIDSSGRERLFCSFYGGVKEGYVYEMDVGRSFDGAAIPAHFTLNPIALGQPQTAGRVDRCFAFGTASGVATLTVSRSVNYYDPDSSVSTTMTMGSTSDDATVAQKPARGGFDFPIEGYDLTLRFDSSTALEGPHCLQLLHLLIDPRGTSRGHLRDR